MTLQFKAASIHYRMVCHQRLSSGLRKSKMQPINLDQPPRQNSGVTKQNDISLEIAGPPQLGDLLPLVAACHLFEGI